MFVNIERIKELIKPEVNKLGAELISVELHGIRRNKTLKVIVDTEKGITLNECTKISSVISDILDMEDIIYGSYHLEVSSPGIDRPLKTTNDFKKNIGRNVAISYMVDENKSTYIEGKIVDINETSVKIIKKNEEKEIKLSNIKSAKIKLPW